MKQTVALPVRALTREAFAPFGDVISVAGADSYPINAGRTDRFNALARVDIRGPGAEAVISIFRGQPLAPPIIDMLERHPLGSQAFMPLCDRPYWVVVAPPGDFDSSAVKAFLADCSQGINYRAGTWHAPLLPLFPDSDFLVVDRHGEGENCDMVMLEEPFQLVKG